MKHGKYFCLPLFLYLSACGPGRLLLGDKTLSETIHTDDMKASEINAQISVVSEGVRAKCHAEFQEQLRLGKPSTFISKTILLSDGDKLYCTHNGRIYNMAQNPGFMITHFDSEEFTLIPNEEVRLTFLKNNTEMMARFIVPVAPTITGLINGAYIDWGSKTGASYMDEGSGKFDVTFHFFNLPSNAVRQADVAYSVNPVLWPNTLCVDTWSAFQSFDDPSSGLYPVKEGDEISMSTRRKGTAVHPAGLGGASLPTTVKGPTLNLRIHFDDAKISCD